MTANAMCIGNGFTPLEVNRLAIERGLLVDGCLMATFDLTRFSDEAPVLTRISDSYVYVPMPASEITSLWRHVRRGNPAICRIDFTPDDPADSQHWVYVAAAYGSEDNPGLIYNDPWQGVQIVANQRYKALARHLVRTVLYTAGAKYGIRSLEGQDAPAILPDWAMSEVG